MRSRYLSCLVMLLQAGPFAAVAAAGSTPVAVSPGHPTHLAQVEGRCPTFNWGAVSGATSYQLVVYRLAEGDSGEEAQAVVRATVPGAALGWTPALEQCLERGGRYAWTVRAVGRGEGSEWSTPALFEVAAPTLAEFEEALAVVRSYLALQNGTGSGVIEVAEGESEAEPDSGPAATAETPGTRAAAATALKVDLGVEAASFKGDGSSLTALTPGNISAGTAAIDISGNAATATTATTATTASDLACTDCVSETELDFDPSTQAELDGHKASGDHDATYVNTTGDTMTGALSMGSNIITGIGAAGAGFTPTGGLDLEDDLTLTKSFQVPQTIDSTTGVLYKHVSTPAPAVYRFLHNYEAAGTDGYNLFLGQNAGNFTMAAGTPFKKLHASYNTGIGADVLFFNTSGNANTVTGASALVKNTTGFRNSAFGAWALLDNTTGSGNTASGVDALRFNTTGGSNIAYGLSAMEFNIGGSSNTAVGVDTLRYNTAGEANVALGYRAGDNITSGSYNIMIGYNIDAPSGTGSNQMSIGNLIFATGVDGTGATMSSGNVGIGTTSPGQKLEVVGSVQASGFMGDGSGLTGVSADAASNADLLDSLDSTQFLRSDASDVLTSGTLTLAPGSSLDVDGALLLPASGISGAGASSGLDADLLDGADSSAFLASGTAWLLSGNAGTTPGADFVGTTDAQALELHANSTSLLRLAIDAVMHSEASANTPLDIPDNFPPGLVDSITVGDYGLATTFSVALHLTNSDLTTVRVELTAPDSSGYVLFDGGTAGTEIDTSYPVPTPPVSGDLTTWIGSNPVGTWQLEIIDSGFLNNTTDGQLLAWSINFDTLSDPNVQVLSRLGVDGEISATGPIGGPGPGLTNLNASNLETGTVPSGRLSGTYGIDISGNAATATAATALASDPTNCPAGQSPEGVNASGNAEGCFDVATQSELVAHTSVADAHREHATLEESAEIDADISAHTAISDAHHPSAPLIVDSLGQVIGPVLTLDPAVTPDGAQTYLRLGPTPVFFEVDRNRWTLVYASQLYWSDVGCTGTPYIASAGTPPVPPMNSYAFGAPGVVYAADTTPPAATITPASKWNAWFRWTTGDMTDQCGTNSDPQLVHTAIQIGDLKTLPFVPDFRLE